MKKAAYIILCALAVLLFWNCSYGELIEDPVEIPISLSTYEQSEAGKNLSLGSILLHRMNASRFNIATLIIFLAAIAHTFATPKIQRFANKIHKNNTDNSTKIHLWSNFLHLLGEVEVVFGLWCVPLVICMIYTFGWHKVSSYFRYTIDYSEPIFVFVIMVIASTKPILTLAENILGRIAKIGNQSPIAWWLTILIISPMMGSFITEPAAITIGAMLLSKQFYIYHPSNTLKYATLGLLFVNISVGGTLTHFAAPPILMVVNKWSLTLSDVFLQFGRHAIVGIVTSTLLYCAIFRKEFRKLNEESKGQTSVSQTKIPISITIIHILFLVWTIFNLHVPTLVIAGLLFFIGFMQITAQYQGKLNIRSPLLVGFFLAGLITHGNFQAWWLSPVLSSLSESVLFFGATILTAFNDNAAITYLCSMVPNFSTNHALQHAVLAGAVTGGGLTVIANAPNPAGQSILSTYFPSGISPLKLFLGALVPTIIMAICFMV
ncbi:MAG: putative Na+/H+ antiporter [Opitutales bacterium]|nr:putative Na+/H+ antiporter [Opitutales bacterium]